MGHYYSKTGDVLWMTSRDAAVKAKEEGVEYDWKDALAHYRPVYLGD